MVGHFHAALQLANESKPLYIYIDSLDQLSDANNGRKKLTWLPLKLPDHVYVVVSTLPDVGGCLAALKSTKEPEHNYTEVSSLTLDDPHIILDLWLNAVNRKLTAERFK